MLILPDRPVATLPVPTLTEPEDSTPAPVCKVKVPDTPEDCPD